MLGWLYNPYGFILVAIAIIHFIRRRPDTFWLWIILMGGGLGALVYIAMEVIPDLGLLRGEFKFMERQKRIGQMQQLVMQNPSAGNYEELADLYLENGRYAAAKECYDKAISARTDSPDPFYRRAICEIELKEFPAAIPDLQRVVTKEPKYDFQRAQALLAHAYANTGKPEEARTLFENVTSLSTSSETYYNYAQFLKQQGRTTEAREWAQKILDKKPAMPGYLRRRERPWFRKANSLLKELK
jgi:hypothetical protein